MSAANPTPTSSNTTATAGSTTATTNTETILFEDEFVKCTHDTIEIKCYYFPTGSSAKIRYSDITVISLYRGASFRVWGSGDFHHWWACDGRRLGRAFPPRGYIFIEIKGGYWINCFTSTIAMEVLRIVLERNPAVRRVDKVRKGLRLVNYTEGGGDQPAESGEGEGEMTPTSAGASSSSGSATAGGGGGRTDNAT